MQCDRATALGFLLTNAPRGLTLQREKKRRDVIRVAMLCKYPYAEFTLPNVFVLPLWRLFHSGV